MAFALFTAPFKADIACEFFIIGIAVGDIIKHGALKHLTSY